MSGSWAAGTGYLFSFSLSLSCSFTLSSLCPLLSPAKPPCHATARLAYGSRIRACARCPLAQVHRFTDADGSAAGTAVSHDVSLLCWLVPNSVFQHLGSHGALSLGALSSSVCKTVSVGSRGFPLQKRSESTRGGRELRGPRERRDSASSFTAVALHDPSSFFLFYQSKSQYFSVPNPKSPRQAQRSPQPPYHFDSQLQFRILKILAILNKNSVLWIDIF